MNTTKEKSLPMAIGLNFLLPGAGYMYMGKVILGLLALWLYVVFAFLAENGFVLMWFMFNIIMGIDMYVIWKRRNKKI